MEQQGREKRSKNRDDASASGSRALAPGVRKKRLAKRQRSNLRDDSGSDSPHGSPRRARSPPTPDEAALVMHAPDDDDREVVNYNKPDKLSEVVKQREIKCYDSGRRERGTDERFWTFFQQDWYTSVLLRKTKPVVDVQWINWEYMRKKKDANFDRIMEACEFHGLMHIMQFQYNWNDEIIAQFYATLYFDKEARIFKWMTKGRRFAVKLTQFAEILGMTGHMEHPKKLHDGRVMTNREMAPMYVPGSGSKPPHTDGFLPPFAVLHRMVRKTLAPRIGDALACPAYERNLLDAIMGQEHFDAFEYIVAEIWNISVNPLRSCGYAPYIMCLIETVTGEQFVKDVKHKPLYPALAKVPVRRRGASPVPDVVPPPRTTQSGASSSRSSSGSSGLLKMLRGIFSMCRRTDQRLDVLERRTNVLLQNQHTIHSQSDLPLQEFPEEPIYPAVPDPYASLTPAELAYFGVGSSRRPADDDDDDDDGGDGSANDEPYDDE